MGPIYFEAEAWNHATGLEIGIKQDIKRLINDVAEGCWEAV
jgi:hypothetical protein